MVVASSPPLNAYITEQTCKRLKAMVSAQDDLILIAEPVQAMVIHKSKAIYCIQLFKEEER